MMANAGMLAVGGGRLIFASTRRPLRRLFGRAIAGGDSPPAARRRAQRRRRQYWRRPGAPGKEVLVIDEHASRDDIAATFGPSWPATTCSRSCSECSLADVLVEPMPACNILPAARATKTGPPLTAAQQQPARRRHPRTPCRRHFGRCRNRPSSGFFALAGPRKPFSSSRAAASITEAYSAIKKLSYAFARQHFRILVNKVRSAGDGRSIFDNIAQVAAQRALPARIRRFRYPSTKAMHVSPASFAGRSSATPGAPPPRPFAISPRACRTGRVPTPRPAGSNTSCSNCYT